MSASERADRLTNATLLVSGWAPPTPSICRASGLPMIRIRRSSRTATSVGRSPATKKAPFDVPPRINVQRTPAGFIKTVDQPSEATSLIVYLLIDASAIGNVACTVRHVAMCAEPR